MNWTLPASSRGDSGVVGEKEGSGEMIRKEIAGRGGAMAKNEADEDVTDRLASLKL